MTSELAETNASKEWMPRAVGMLASWTMLPMLTRYSNQWNPMELNLLSIWRQLEFYLFIIIIIIFFWPRYSIPEERKKYAMQYKKVQKSSWNEPYSSSSFTKQSCSKMALYRWIKTERRWNKKVISLSSPDWSASLRSSLERKTWPNALIGRNDSTATGWKMWWVDVWIFHSLTSGCLFCCWTSLSRVLCWFVRHNVDKN